MVMDVWSRRILGVEVHGEQSSKLARAFFDRICRDAKINKESATVLHSENEPTCRRLPRSDYAHLHKLQKWKN